MKPFASGRKQSEGESVSQFVTRLREISGRCDFHDQSREIKDQVLQRGSSDRLRRR